MESTNLMASVVQLATLVVGLFWHVDVAAMTFKVVAMRGEPAILAKGGIANGDAERFSAVLTPTAKHSLGYYTLVLESPGGSTKAAFELSRVIDAHYVNTYVAKGAMCVSACAAIVFIAGREHIALPGALLGFHGCYNLQTLSINSLCNEAIAEHAVAHGTAYGAVMGVISEVPYNKVVWLDGRDADCWGVNRYDISPRPPNYSQCATEMLKELGKELREKSARARQYVR